MPTQGEQVNAALLWITLPFAILAVLLSTFTLRTDGLHHYESTRSLVLDRDLNTYNEREFYTDPLWSGVAEGPGAAGDKASKESGIGELVRFVNVPEYTSKGYRTPYFPIGQSLWQLPAFLLAHGLNFALAHWGRGYLPDGYSPLYIYIGALVGALFHLLSLLLMYRLCLRYFAPWISALAAGLELLGTNLPATAFVDPFFSHAATSFLLTALVYTWVTARQVESREGYFLVGLLLGLIALTRHPTGLVALVVAADLFLSLCSAAAFSRERLAVRERIELAACAAAGIPLGFLPQLAVWQILYGRFIPDAQMLCSDTPQVDMRHPLLVEFFFSNAHGLLNWTPLLLAVLLGLFFLLRKDRRLGLFVLGLLVVLCYVNASRKDFWNLGFGIRRMTDLSGVWVLLLAAFIDGLKKDTVQAAFAVLGLLLGAWNFVFTCQYYLGRSIYEQGAHLSAIAGTFTPYGKVGYRLARPSVALIPDLVRDAVSYVTDRAAVGRALAGNQEKLLFVLCSAALILLAVYLTRRFVSPEAWRRGSPRDDQRWRRSALHVAAAISALNICFVAALAISSSTTGLLGEVDLTSRTGASATTSLALSDFGPYQGRPVNWVLGPGQHGNLQLQQPIDGRALVLVLGLQPGTKGSEPCLNATIRDRLGKAQLVHVPREALSGKAAAGVRKSWLVERTLPEGGVERRAGVELPLPEIVSAAQIEHAVPAGGSPVTVHGLGLMMLD